MAKGKRTNKRTKRSKTAAKAVSRAKKANFKKAVKEVIAEQEETKQAYINSGDSLISFNSGITTSADMLQVLPSVSVGTADNQRIGDQLRAQRLNIRGYMKLYPKTQTGTVSNEPRLSNVVARLMVVSMKMAQNYSLATNQFSQLTALLKKGGTTTAFTGLLSDINAPINTDVFTVHHDSVHYLTQDYVFVPSSSAGTYVNAPVAIDLKDSIRFFNINLKCKNKLLKYDQVAGGGINPNNYAPFMVLGYSYLDGSSPDSLNTQVGLHYISTLNFEG